MSSPIYFCSDSFHANSVDLVWQMFFLVNIGYKFCGILFKVQCMLQCYLSFFHFATWKFSFKKSEKSIFWTRHLCFYNCLCLAHGDLKLKEEQTWTRSNKEHFSINLCYRHTDWLINISQPIRALKISKAHFNDENFLYRIGPRFSYNNF